MNDRDPISQNSHTKPHEAQGGGGGGRPAVKLTTRQQETAAMVGGGGPCVIATRKFAK